MIRSISKQIYGRLAEKRRFIQVLAGPRQVGKTTVAKDAINSLKKPVHLATADTSTIKERGWIVQQWELGRITAGASYNGGVLVLDEIQKITGWSETVKWLWDEDSASGLELHVLLLGSSPLLIQSGLSESLAGRFEIIHATHWSYSEMKEAFGWSLDEYLYFGGYPGAAPLINDELRWSQYIKESLIETTISRDVLLMNRVDKPAILRRLFEVACSYSGQILSYQKMVGQLQDRNNTVTIAHYLDLLSGIGMVTGLQKYSGQIVRRKNSSPKLQVYNTALPSAFEAGTFMQAQLDRNYWGRLSESAVGAHLLNMVQGSNIELQYWRENNAEVDFVMTNGKEAISLEVKTSRIRESHSGLEAFRKAWNPLRTIVVGTGGIPIEEFLLSDPKELF